MLTVQYLFPGASITNYHILGDLIGIYYLTALEIRSPKSRYHMSYYSGKKQKQKLNSKVLITWYM